MSSPNPVTTEIYKPEKTDSRSERRRESRYPLHTLINTSFYNKGNLFHGKIGDLSPCGVCIHLLSDKSEKTPELAIQQTIECYILNRYGRSKYRGTIRWVNRKNMHLYWGISFIELSSHRKDPFRQLIAEICREKRTYPVTGMAVY